MSGTDQEIFENFKLHLLKGLDPKKEEKKKQWENMTMDGFKEELKKKDLDYATWKTVAEGMKKYNEKNNN